MLDIGTEAIKAVLFTSTSDGVAVHGLSREVHNTGDIQRGAVTDFAGIITTAQRAVANAEKHARMKAEEIILVLGTDFLSALPVMFQERRVNPKLKINEVELKNIFHKIYVQSLEKLRARSLQEGSYTAEDIKIVDAYIQDIKIDGYDVENPLGLEGKVIGFNVFYSFLFAAFENIIMHLAESLKRPIRQVYAPSFSISAVIRKDTYPLADFITIDIGGASTELALTRKGMVSGIKNFELGGRTITQRIASELGIGFWEAEGIKQTYAAGRLSAFVSKKIKDIIQRDIDLWQSGLEFALREISFLNILPSDIFVYGGASAFPDLRDILYKTEWYQSLPFSGKPTVKFLDTRSIKGITFLEQEGKDVSYPDIVSFATCRIVKERMNRSHLQDIFERITRVMET